MSFKKNFFLQYNTVKIIFKKKKLKLFEIMILVIPYIGNFV